MAHAAPTLETLATAAAMLRAHERADVREFAERIEAWVASGAALPLERALGLRTRGGVSLRYAQVLAERDADLRRVARECWPERAPRAAAAEIVKAFRAYERFRWSGEEDERVGPTVEPNATWWRLLKARVRMPDERQIAQIIGATR